MMSRLTPIFKRNILLSSVAVILLTALMPHICFADIMKPVAREDAFKGLQLDIEKQKQREQELNQKKEQENAKLNELKKDIVPLASRIRETEQNLIEIERSITQNLIRQSELKEVLKKNQKILSDSLIATLRMKRVPNETLFLQAATPLQTAQTAMILERISPQIKQRVSYLSESYNELAKLQKDLDIQKENQNEQLASLLKEQKNIEQMIEKRQSYVQQTQKDIQAVQKKAQRLSLEAKNVKELIEKVRLQNEAAEREAEIARQKQQEAKKEIVSTGRHNWPVAGTVKVSYGTKDVYGAKTEGIKIETRPNAFVTTPMTGTVRFAGPFKRHGQIVIVEHSGGWHSLISGMESLNVNVGQLVKNGEPVGRMPSQNDDQGLLLYYELRYKGTPTNPSKKIKGLS